MSVFLYQHEILKLTIRQSASVTIKKVEERWLQAGLDVCKHFHAVQKILKLFNDWIKVKKSRYRKKSPAQNKKEALFKDKSGKLFDIA